MLNVKINSDTFATECINEHVSISCRLLSLKLHKCALQPAGVTSTTGNFREPCIESQYWSLSYVTNPCKKAKTLLIFVRFQRSRCLVLCLCTHLFVGDSDINHYYCECFRCRWRTRSFLCYFDFKLSYQKHAAIR